MNRFERAARVVKAHDAANALLALDDRPHPDTVDAFAPDDWSVVAHVIGRAGMSTTTADMAASEYRARWTPPPPAERRQVIHTRIFNGAVEWVGVTDDGRVFTFGRIADRATWAVHDDVCDCGGYECYAQFFAWSDRRTVFARDVAVGDIVASDTPGDDVVRAVTEPDHDDGLLYLEFDRRRDVVRATEAVTVWRPGGIAISDWTGIAPPTFYDRDTCDA